MKNAIIRLLTYTCIPLFLMLLVANPSVAQSNMLHSSLNGVLLELNSGFNIDYQNLETFYEKDLLSEIGVKIGYSIGGTLDVGAEFLHSYSEIAGQSSVETNFSILYGIMLLKQDGSCPISLELNGTYGYSFVDSSYYSDENLQKRGYGYNLNCSMLFDTAPGERLWIRFGLFGGYRTYAYVIESIFPATADEQSYSVERTPEISYGLIFGVLGKNRRGKGNFIYIKPEMNTKMDLKVTVHTGLFIQKQ